MDRSERAQAVDRDAIEEVLDAVRQELLRIGEDTGRKPGQIIGKTPWLQSVHAEGNERLIGRIVEARLVEGHANSLAGEIVTRAWEAAA